MLLSGMDPDGYNYDLKFMGRKVESPNQLMDRLLKKKSLGIPNEMIWSEMGENPEKVKELRAKQAAENDPYEELLKSELGNKDYTIVQGNKRGKQSDLAVKN